jgi:hypothetical protein
LFHGGCAKSVARGEHDRQAFVLQAPCELSDRRRFSRSVDTDDENHEGLARAVDRERLLEGLQDLEKLRRECALERLRIGEFGARNPRMQVGQDGLGRVDADVALEQARFELVQQLGVDAPSGKEIRDPGCAAIDARAQAREEARIRRRRRNRAYGWITVVFVITMLSPSLARKSAI